MTRSPALLAAARAASLVFLALLAGCRPPSWFAEYLYPSSDTLVNLAADRTFASAWRLDPTLTALSEPTLYLGFEEVTDVDPPELAAPLVADTAVYRLELKSLIPDGDLSTATPGQVTLGEPSSGWAFYVPPGQTVTTEIHEIVDPSNPYAIHGNTLHFSTSTNSERLDYALRQWARDGFLDVASYAVRFSYRADENIVTFEYRDDTDPIQRWRFYNGPDGNPPGGLGNDLIEFPPQSIIDTYSDIAPRGPGQYFLAFGTPETPFSGVVDVYVDDFRMVRTDLMPRIQMRLPYQLSLPVVGATDGSLYELRSGRYRFSIWVRDDETAGTAPDRYASRALIVTVTGGDIEGTGELAVGTDTFMAVVPRGTDGWPGADPVTGWSQLSVETDSLGLFATADPDAAVMLISISPTDWYTDAGRGYDAGSILLCAPVLQFISALP